MSKEINKTYSYTLDIHGMVLEFIGEADEIEMTLKHYSNQDPLVVFDCNKLGLISGHDIFCYQPFFRKDDVVIISAPYNIKLEITTNALKFVAEQFTSLEKIKRGKLYKFVSGPHGIPTFLPYDVAKFLSLYDWSTHAKAYSDSVKFKEDLIASSPRLMSNPQCQRD